MRNGYTPKLSLPEASSVYPKRFDEGRFGEYVSIDGHASAGLSYLRPSKRGFCAYAHGSASAHKREGGSFSAGTASSENCHKTEFLV